jgi:hypothetical protein
MHKLILISAFLLASVAAQAGQSRSLILAANDEPQAAAKVETAKPAEAQPEAAQTDVKADAAQPEAAKPYAAKPARKVQARRYESDEHKARRIAARYGVYW